MGRSAFATTLTVGGVAVAKLTSVTGPSLSRETIDTSNHDSADYISYVSGLSDPGEVSIEGMFDSSAGQDDLIEHFELQTTPSFVITYGTLATFTFTGFLTAFSANAPYDGALTFSATIKVTGEPVLAAV
jgi:predicted secreted protein